MTEPKSSATSIDVGERLRVLREQRGLSQRELAAASGLSPNALSQIERGTVSPNVSTLNQLADALGIHITAFFETTPLRQRVVFLKADQRTRVPFALGLMEGLGGERFVGQADAFYLTLESGGSSGPHPVTHTGNEFVFCLRGKLEYTIEESVFVLGSGDSLSLEAEMTHKRRNAAGTVTNASVVIMGGAPIESPEE